MQQTIGVNDRTTASHVGTTPSTGPFAVDFPFFSLDDVTVTLLPDGVDPDLATLLVRGADYTLTAVATEDGSFSNGTITLLLPVSNATVTRYGDTDIQRLSNFPLQGFFSRLALNAEFNRVTVVLQELERDLGDINAELDSIKILLESVALSGFVSLITFGAKGNGIADDTKAIRDALTYFGNTGAPGRLYIPSGTYIQSDTAGVMLSNDLEIFMDSDAVIKATASFPASGKMWQILAPDSLASAFRIKITGGKFDGSLRPPVAPGTAADILNIGGAGIAQCIIDNVWFHSNADRTGTAGDSGVFFAAGRNLTISNCIFEGCVDSAIYLSGDSTETFGDNATFYNNTYRECFGAISSKRRWRCMTVWGEDIQGVGVAISTAEADTAPVLLPGLDITVSECNIRSCQRGIDVRWSDGAKVSNNKITDYGLAWPAGTPVVESAILVEGSSNCLIDGNTPVISSYVPVGGQTAIRLLSRTIDGVTRHSTNNLIVHNQIDTVTRGIVEDDANQDSNRYLDNVVLNTTVPYILLGPNSTVDKGLGSNRRELDYAFVSLAGSLGAEAIRAVRTANGVNWWQVQGSMTGGNPALSVTGPDPDISMLIVPRGLGSVVVGPLGSESLRIARVASQVNRVQITGAIAGSPAQIIATGSDTNVGLMLVCKAAGNVMIPLANVPTFANDAAAAAGGVPIGGIYRNASALQIRIV